MTSHPARTIAYAAVHQPDTHRRQRLQVLLVMAVPIGTLAAASGTYSWATLPILVAAAVAFLTSGARVGAGANRRLDWALLACLGAAALQLAPVPPNLAAAVSPHVDDLRRSLYLTEHADLQPLSLNPRLTRAGVATLASALLVFWAAREVFGRGGSRQAARAIAFVGFAMVLTTVAQRATAPTLLLWTWTPADRGTQPFGPFLNRNHLGTWLLMGASLTAGYLVSHSRAVGSGHTTWRLRLRDWLADGNGLLLAAALLAMIVGLGTTVSRSAILGAFVAVTVAIRSRGAARGLGTRLVAGGLVLMLGWAVWSNRDELASKFDGPGSIARAAIWRDTLPVIADFWITGTGLGTYGPSMLRYQAHARELHFNQAHNEYLQLAAEGGLLLGVPTIVALAVGLRLAGRRVREDTRVMAWVRVGAAAGLTGVAAQGLFETGLRVPANALLAAILAAIVVHEPHGR